MLKDSDTAVSKSGSTPYAPGNSVATHPESIDTVVSPPQLRTQGGDIIEPTPENYLKQNPTVPPFLKYNVRQAARFERNALCRFVGGSGSYYGDKYRTWIMSFSAFISFTCLMLMIVVLISCAASAELVTAFGWVKGEAHWQLMIPVDWTDTMYLGLGGMTNVTKRGDSYYVKYTAKECTEVLEESCAGCQTASIEVLVFIAISIAAVVPGFLLDLHRIFKYFDLNLSKMLAMTLHLVFGVIFTVLAYISFIAHCFMKLPSYAVHQGEGKKGVGMYLTWELSAIAHLMLALVIIRPIPGLLHLLVPTPKWANNKGMKAMRNKLRDQDKQLDPFAPDAADIMKHHPVEKVSLGPYSTNADTFKRSSQYGEAIIPYGEAIQVDMSRELTTSTVEAPDRQQAAQDRKASAAVSEGDFGELVSQVHTQRGDLPTLPKTQPAAASRGTGETGSRPMTPGEENEGEAADDADVKSSSSAAGAESAPTQPTPAAQPAKSGGKKKKGKK